MEKTFKAVEYMRKMRDQLNKKYSNLSMEDRIKKIHQDAQKTELWKKLHKKDKVRIGR